MEHVPYSQVFQIAKIKTREIWILKQKIQITKKKY